MRKPSLLNTRTAVARLMPGSFGIAQMATRSSSTFVTPASSASTCSHSRMAVLMFSTASSRVVPWEWQPGSTGQRTDHPWRVQTGASRIFPRILLGLFHGLFPIAVSAQVEMWLTNPDQSALFQKQRAVLNFAAATNQHPTIVVDDAKTYQTIDGFG